MDKVRVLHVLNSLGVGGIETFLINIYRNINKDKVQFDFLIQTADIQFYEEEILGLGGVIYRVKPRSFSLKQNISDLNDFFKKQSKNYTTVHFHVSSLSDISAMMIAKKYGVKNRIVHSHNVKAGGSKIHTYLHYINKSFLSVLGTHFFACSLDAGKWMYTNKILQGDKFKVINNAIDLKKFEFKLADRLAIREELGVEEDSIVLGHIGRFHPQKNHKFLISSFKEYFKRNSNSYLVLVGSGALQDEMEEFVFDNGLKSRVFFLGLRKDTSKIISGLDCFVFPSLYEGLGIVLVEAQANGVPIVAASNNIPHVIKINNNFNFMRLEDDLSVWADCIESISKKGRVNGREEIDKAGFNLEKVTKELELFYIMVS